MSLSLPLSPLSTSLLARLRDTARGQIITPDATDYDAARTVFHGGIERRPAAIVRPIDADDVARVVTFAADTGTELAVRSGGHNAAGHSLSDGGIVLDLRSMQALDIDPAARTAWAQTGLTAGEYSNAAGAHGLATSFGDTGSVGIGGITLAGGIGFLVRKHGMTIDSLLAVEVVTADGRVLQVDDTNHPDLFWAIRGGGGNFGVVTRVTLRLHPVDPFVGGLLFLPATPEVIAGFMELAAAAPDELSTIANVMVAPPMPFLPEHLHGQLVVMGFMAYAGPVGAAEQAIQPFRDLAEPLADLVKAMPYPEMFMPAQEDYHPLSAGETMFLSGFDLPAADTALGLLADATAAMAVVHLRALGGAMARVPEDATAFAHRQRPIMSAVAAVFEDPRDAPTHQGWVDRTAAALRARWGAPGAYIGFMTDDDKVREAYPGATWDRLVDVKGRYDPDNVFRLNHNIPPAGGRG